MAKILKNAAGKVLKTAAGKILNGEKPLVPLTPLCFTAQQANSTVALCCDGSPSISYDSTLAYDAQMEEWVGGDLIVTFDNPVTDPALLPWLQDNEAKAPK